MKSLLIVAVGIAAWTGSPASAAVIYQESFTGARETFLDGKTVTASSGTFGGTKDATWTSSTVDDAWSRDGFAKAGNGNTNDSRNAFLAFTPSSGDTYTFAVEVDSMIGLATKQFLQIGFASGRDTAADFDSQGVAWMELTDLNAYALNSAAATSAGGSGTLGLGTNEDASGTFSIELDTTGSQWAARWFHQPTGGANVELHSYTYTTNPTISHVGFGITKIENGSTHEVHLGSATLSAVPEPGSALVGLLLAVGLMHRRRPFAR